MAHPRTPPPRIAAVGRVQKLIILVALACLAALAAGSATAAAAPRFQGQVRGAVTGPGHNFFVGDGLGLTFRDRRHAHTRYTVCWKGPQGDKHCWHRTTGARGKLSWIGTSAPDHIGSYVTKWIVNDRVVAHWRFYNHIGD
jgi:hypothetical protein